MKGGANARRTELVERDARKEGVPKENNEC